MAWSKIPNLQGLRAAKNWLRDLAPDRQERVLRKYKQDVRKLEGALAEDKELLRTFQIVLEHSRFFGRVDGLREGLDLYEYGTRIQKENTVLFQTIMNYIARCAGQYDDKKKLANEISAERVCEYLDREIERTKQQKTSEIRIKPPWGCNTWESALREKSSNVRRLISKAKSEALSEHYCTLMAWKTWCREAKPKRRAATDEQSMNDRTLEIGREEKAPA
jgi:hypothetical protein